MYNLHYVVWYIHFSVEVWGAIAGGFGEGMMHPVKTRRHSQASLTQGQVCYRFAYNQICNQNDIVGSPKYLYGSYCQACVHFLAY